MRLRFLERCVGENFCCYQELQDGDLYKGPSLCFRALFLEPCDLGCPSSCGVSLAVICNFVLDRRSKIVRQPPAQEPKTTLCPLLDNLIGRSIVPPESGGVRHDTFVHRTKLLPLSLRYILKVAREPRDRHRLYRRDEQVCPHSHRFRDALKAIKYSDLASSSKLIARPPRAETLRTCSDYDTMSRNNK